MSFKDRLVEIKNGHCDGRMLLIFFYYLSPLNRHTLMMFVDSNGTESTKGVNATGQSENLARCVSWLSWSNYCQLSNRCYEQC